MDAHGFLYRLTEWIETLPDRPFMILLFIIGASLMMLPFVLLLGKLARMLADIGGDDKELGKLGAELYGGAGADGRIDGVPASFTTGPMIVKGNVVGYEAEFTYGVANPLGLRLVVHRAGLLNRPLELLPPKVPDAPESLKAAGYTLRCAPPELAAEAARRAAAFAPFAAGGNLTELTLKDGELKARLEADADWQDAALRALLKAGAAAARNFN